MKKHIALTVLAILGFVANSHAAVLVSITSNPTSGAQIFLSDGPPSIISDGSHVRIGTFVDGANNHVEPSATSTFTTLATSFREFAFLSSGHTAATGQNEGRINFTNIAGAPTGEPDSFFVGKKIYIWVYNQPSPGAGAAPAASDSLQQGVFSTSSLVFLDQATAVSFSLNNATRAYGRYDAPGTQASSNSTTDNAVTQLKLAAVPEPSTAALGLLAGLGLMIRRRRD